MPVLKEQPEAELMECVQKENSRLVLDVVSSWKKKKVSFVSILLFTSILVQDQSRI